MANKQETPPAEGERRAMVGYTGQYRAQACIILRALRENNLDWIRIADPEAKKLDDFQIGTPARVDAFQITGSSHPRGVTFKILTDGTPNLLQQIVQGRKSLVENYAGKRIVAHFLTNDHPSASAGTIPTDPTKKPMPAHLSAFLEQVWKPLERGHIGFKNIPSAWKTAWSALATGAGLTTEELEETSPDLRLDLDFRTDLPPPETTREGTEFEAEIADIAHFLADLVGSPERVVVLSRSELLERLGWAQRFEFRNRHEFPVDRTTYFPLEESVAQLEAALDLHTTGYISVVGTPGSGKSTMLTECVRNRKERVIRYYAYVRDDLGPSNLRGESENFLHDVTTALRRAGVFDPGTGRDRNRTELCRDLPPATAFRSRGLRRNGTSNANSYRRPRSCSPRTGGIHRH